MKKYNFLSAISFLFVISSAFILASCSNDDNTDTTAPVIKLDEPEDGDKLRIGADVHFECYFEDNVMLGSYMIEIHNNFDGHSHDTRSNAEDGEKFFFKKSYDLKGHRTKHEHHHDIVIPENTMEGNYHLVVYCTDAAGNESLVARNIILSHDGEVHDHEHEHDHDDED